MKIGFRNFLKNRLKASAPKSTMSTTHFNYVLSYEEGIRQLNKLRVGEEYELLDLVSSEWKKQIYLPPNEQETFEKMLHGIRYGWIKPIER